MRNTSQRRETILQLLARQGAVQVTELVDQLGVSAVTIRHDLSALGSQGLVTRSHGGAVLTRVPPPEQTMRQKDALYHEQKERIGAFAASLVEAGDNIVIDSGTTTI